MMWFRIINNPRLIFLIGSLLALSACSVGREYHTPKTETLAQDKFLEQDQGRFRATEPVAAWWRQLGDDQLTLLVEQGLEHNLDIQIALANLQEARFLLSETTFDRFPTVETQGKVTRQLQSKEAIFPPFGNRTQTTYNAGFDAFWELNLFGRVSQRIAASEANLEAREADLDATYVTIAAEVARTYVELRGGQYRLEVARRNADNQQQTYNLTKDLFEAGASDGLDMERARTQLELTKSTIPPLEAEVNSAMNRLAVLTGQPPTTFHVMLQSVEPLPSIPTTVDVGDPMALLQRRPDIRAAERDLASAVAEYNVNVTDLYPNVTVKGSLGFSSTSISDLVTGSAGTYLIGPQINWAAFNLGRVFARIDAADARAKARLASFEKTVLRALEETESAMVNFSRQEQSRARLQDAAVSSAKAAKFAEERFDAGIDNFLDVLVAQATMLEAQDRLANSEINVALNLVAIYKALGGGWQVKTPSTNLSTDVAVVPTATRQDIVDSFMQKVPTSKGQ
ncbi:efflux transporter outer membrane subunit [Candidatus Nitronereus thalassa]|uniref:Efflux transporter outer membrane subunit n=1 Tax=Candidatus Nitronereus thalassa TaxID=3020898 RepID=A0ABU3KCT6_9BACT|nr:efflux transporter outer membrane subunit [Candidatus Nitronereus thalassa]MDT7044284.1 efflux transporter outer membrane subunit [Candidatus Nitronereus thalassa]